MARGRTLVTNGRSRKAFGFEYRRTVEAAKCGLFTRKARRATASSDGTRDPVSFIQASAHKLRPPPITMRSKAGCTKARPSCSGFPGTTAETGNVVAVTGGLRPGGPPPGRGRGYPGPAQGRAGARPRMPEPPREVVRQGQGRFPGR